VASFPQLSLADVYAALAYYHDHREQIDQDIREDAEFFRSVKLHAGPTLLNLPQSSSTDGGNPIPS
jgi:hypothetical protein